ncbi:MAG: AAA family ATPase [Promethearchaeota archaeon]
MASDLKSEKIPENSLKSKNININEKDEALVLNAKEPKSSEVSSLENLDINSKIIQNSRNCQKKLDYNVIFPDENNPDYYPLLEFNGALDQKINELELIRLAIERDRNAKLKHVTTFYFYSPPGLGKTVMGAYLAKCYKCPYQVVNCVNSMIDLDLLGSQVLLGEDTIWQDGPITSIIRAVNDFGMGILIINELNTLTVNAQMALNPLLDRQEAVVLTQNNNELVKIAPTGHLLIIASMNPDVMGINDLQDSVRDRASAIIHMTYPNIDKEQWLLQKLTKIDKNWAIKFCEVIAECRRAKFIDKNVTKAPSTRALLDWINYSRVWGPMLAFELTIANRYCAGINIEEAKILLRIAAGKGVAKWKLPENFCTFSSKSTGDSFFFPNPDYYEVKKAKPRSYDQIKIVSKNKKKRRQIQKAKDLKLSPLDSFFLKKKEDPKK